jgi:hypothetical protein
MNIKITAIILLITLILVTGLIVIKNNSNNPSSLSSPVFENNCQKNTNPIFTSHVTDLNKVKLINPPGSVVNDIQQNNVLKTHSFVVVKEKAPIYAPIDSTLYTGAFYTEEGKTQYSLFFEASCEVFYITDHVHEVVDKIKTAFPDPPSKTTQSTDLKNPIPFKSGELIGYSTGTKNARHWDFGVYNKKKPNHLKNETQYKLHNRDLIANCPYDYFPSDMRKQYYATFDTIISEDSTPTTFCNTP